MTWTDLPRPSMRSLGAVLALLAVAVALDLPKIEIAYATWRCRAHQIRLALNAAGRERAASAHPRS